MQEGSAIHITVERTRGINGTVSATWRTQGGTAKPGTNFEGSSGVVTLDSGVMRQIFTVDVFDSGMYECHIATTQQSHSNHRTTHIAITRRRRPPHPYDEPS